MYRCYSYKRKKSRKGAIAFILLVLALLCAKTYNVGFLPGSAIAEKETPAVPKSVEAFDFSFASKISDDISTDVDESGEAVESIAFKTSESGKSESDSSEASDLNEVYTNSSFMISVQLTPGDTLADRQKLNDALVSEETTDKEKVYLKKILSNFADEWLFNRTVIAGDELCTMYCVAPGDVLSSIAKKFDIPYGIIMRINNIKSPKSLRAGAAIKVIQGPFNCKVSRSEFTLDLYLQDTFVRSYPIGLGKPGMETPTGLWVVKSGGKMVSPPWTDPDTGRTYSADDTDYPLGTRWIGLDGIDGFAKGRTGFAIHGSDNASEIGTAISRGCVRMQNSDVELIYDLMKPGKSKVVVSD